MCRKRSLALGICTAILAPAGVCIAGTITSASAGLYISDVEGPVASCNVGPGTSAVQCSASKKELLTRCSGYYCFDVPYVASGTVMASSAFGALSAGITEAMNPVEGMAGHTPFSFQGGFDAFFNNLLLVTGGAGTGTLVAHFSWNAEAFSASYVQFEFDLNSYFGRLINCSVGASPCSGTSDISLPFTFGQLIPIEGELTGSLPFNGLLAIEQFNTEATLTADLTLTGFSVYDAAGNLLPGAQVTQTILPEPGSGWLLMCGMLVLLKASSQRRDQASGRRSSSAPPHSY